MGMGEAMRVLLCLGETVIFILFVILFFSAEIEPKASRRLDKHPSTEQHVHSYLTAFYFETKPH